MLKNLENKFKFGLDSTQQLPASGRYNSLSVSWSMLIKKKLRRKQVLVWFVFLNKLNFSYTTTEEEQPFLG